MADAAKLRELLERVEKASGPDRDLDARIASVLKMGDGLPDWAKGWKGEWTPTIEGAVVLRHDDGTPGPNFTAGPVTASLDASIALVERMFDGAIWGVTIPANWSGRKRKPKFEAHVTNNNEIGTKGHIFALADGKTAPLAILSALLRALISQAEGEGA